jgi:hypothetical protein
MEVVMNRLARWSALAAFAAVALASSACSSPPPADTQTGAAPAAAAVPAAPTDAEAAAVPAASTDGPAAAVPAAGDAPAPAAERAKYYRPVKGTASIELIRGPSKRVGQDIVSELKIKNTSNGRIDLLVVDEYWYDTNRENVTGTSERYRKPFNPGDVIELTLKSPAKPNLQQSLLMFSHANGNISPKEVKKFTEDKE